MVLGDSFAEIADAVRGDYNETVKGADKKSYNEIEKWMVDLMVKHNEAANAQKLHTCFVFIQQVNKGGTFVGSNKLKHMTTGMMEIRFVDERSQDERYVTFTKNRRGHVGKQMYFDLAASGNVTYDTARFKKSESLKQLKKAEQEKIKKSGVKFDVLFGLDKDKETTK